jgi:hypothetical protein
MLVSCLAAAALNGMGALPFTIGQAVGAAVSVISGVWLRGAARSVDSIVRTEGSDVSHLMSAMRDLTRMFDLQRTVLVAAFVVGGLAIVLSLLFVFVLMPGRIG